MNSKITKARTKSKANNKKKIEIIKKDKINAKMIEEKKLNLSLKTSNVFLTNDNFSNQMKINKVSINKCVI